MGSAERKEFSFQLGRWCMIEHFRMLFCFFLSFFSTMTMLLSKFYFYVNYNSFFCFSRISLILTELSCSLFSFSTYSSSYVMNSSSLKSTRLILGLTDFYLMDILFGTTLQSFFRLEKLSSSSSPELFSRFSSSCADRRVSKLYIFFSQSFHVVSHFYLISITKAATLMLSGSISQSLEMSLAAFQYALICISIRLPLRTSLLFYAGWLCPLVSL